MSVGKRGWRVLDGDGVELFRHAIFQECLLYAKENNVPVYEISAFWVEEDDDEQSA